MDSEKQYECTETNIESIAEQIFNELPDKENSYMLIPPIYDTSICFEILLTFFMEGLMILFLNANEINLTEISVSNIIDVIKYLNPWMKSICFQLNVKEFTCDDDKCDDINYYCKIMIKNKNNKKYFDNNNINKNYTFLLNNRFEQTYVLSDYIALFNNNNYTLVISFFVNNK